MKNKNITVVAVIIIIFIVIFGALNSLGVVSISKVKAQEIEGGNFGYLLTNLHNSGYSGDVKAVVKGVDPSVVFIQGKIVKTERMYFCLDHSNESLQKFTQECLGYDDILMLTFEQDVFNK